MMNEKALEYARQNQHRIMAAVDPLIANFPVACFVYMELLGSTDFFFISSDTSWRDEYLRRGSPGETWVQGLKHAASQENPTHIVWSLLESKDPIEQFCVDLGYRYGINIYKKEGNKLRLWAFDGIDAASLHFFQTQKAILEKFVYYFNEQCDDLITEDRIQKNVAQWVIPQEFGLKATPQTPVISHPTQGLFPARHVFLYGKEGPVKLTSRQWEILNKAALGLSMKEIARRLSLSPRTVEDVLQICKKKSGLITRDQLAHFVKMNTIVK